MAALLAALLPAAAASAAQPPLCFEAATLAEHKGVQVALATLLHSRQGQGVGWGPGQQAGVCAPAAAAGQLRVGLDASLPAQHYELRRGRIVGGDTNGVTYGLLDLARLRQQQAGGDSDGGGGVQRGGPAYKSRVYSIEGQWLDLPDVAYYSSTPPYLNASLVAAEASYIARGLPALVRNRVTALVLLHPNVEDYVNYDHLGNGSEVWPQGHPHRQRSAALCPLVSKLVQETQAHGLKFFFKPYELGFPKQLPQLYPLGLGSDAQINSTRAVLRAKYKELFECTGADGKTGRSFEETVENRSLHGPRS